jgi:Vitamin K epoxide reductase family
MRPPIRRTKTTRRDERATVPAGWNYNPSSWQQRWPGLAFAMLGFAAALHLAQYQWRPHSLPWEPFFGDGTRLLLDSHWLSALPVPFATLSAALYLLAALSGALGGVCRWRTLPWLVALFAVCVVPLALVNVALVILQPLLLGTGSTLCLFSALLSVSMVAPALEEMLATLQHLQRTARCGCSWWRAFCGLGGHLRWLELLTEQH